MRLKIVARPASVLAQVKPLIEYAASHFKVTGKVQVEFSPTKKMSDNLVTPYQKLFAGRCYWSRRVPLIKIHSTLNSKHPRLPFKREHLGYFPKSKISITPYELRTVEEIIVYVAAHEFAHLMPRGNKFRKSRIEVFCENRAAEVLEAYRLNYQDWLDKRSLEKFADGESVTLKKGTLAEPEEVRSELCDRLNAVVARREIKRKNLLIRLKRWESKRKRAENACKKLQKQLRSMNAMVEKASR